MHEIEEHDNVMLFKQAAWHGLGRIVKEEYSAVKALEEIGLGWPVEQWTLTATSPDGKATVPIKSHVANMRTDVRELLGVVGADYKICQNRHLAEFTDALAQTGEVSIESCGSIRNGKRVWFLARGESFNVVGKDCVFPYVLVSNGHDGGSAIRVTPTTVRVVCSNTLHMVIPSGDGWGNSEQASIVIKHVGDISHRMDQAKAAMKYYHQRLQQNQEIYGKLQEAELGRDGVMQFFADNYARWYNAPTEKELTSKDTKERNKAEARADRMREASMAFMSRYKDERAELQLKDSVWGAMNALTGWLQHDQTYSGTVDERWVKQMDTNLFGGVATKTQQALDHALQLAG